MTSQRYFISVIIPTYCRAPALRRCITSLANQTFPRELFEVIVIDDGGDPPAARLLSDWPVGSMNTIVLTQSNQGAAAARVSGISRARGEILAFLDDDCTVPPDYLRSIEAVFGIYPGTMVVQVGLENAEPKNIYGQAWKFALEQTLRSNLHRENERFTCGILGGVMVARREVFRYATYDSSFARGREDADFRYQLQKLDVPVYYEPKIKVFHHYRETLPSYLASFFAYGRGEFHLQGKWRGIPSPTNRVKLISWRAFKSLLQTEGVLRGLAVYSILWLKQNAGLWGVLYEKAVSTFPEQVALRWAQFGIMLLLAYASHTAWFCLSVTRRTGAASPASNAAASTRAMIEP